MWAVIDDDYNETEKALLCPWFGLTTNVPFHVAGEERSLGDATMYPNNYKYSNIRSYLNGKQNQFVLDGGTATQADIDWTGKGFIDIAFTNEAEILIDETKVDNSSDSTFPKEEYGDLSNDYAFENTKVRIFLFSARELNNYSDSSLYGWCSDYINANSCYLPKEFYPKLHFALPRVTILINLSIIITLMNIM